MRPHLAKFGPDGLLYVTAELADAIYAVDVHTHKVVSENPTGEAESHMFVLAPDGSRAYTANVSTGTVSVVDLRKHSLITKHSRWPTKFSESPSLPMANMSIRTTRRNRASP